MAFSHVHHPLTFIFGILGNIISICVYFAPLPTFIQICRKKSTLGFQSLPYIVALFSAMLWMYYALLKSDAVLLISINLFGFVIETIYIVLYLVYASKETRIHTWKLLGSLNVGMFTIILLVTHFLFKGDVRVQVVGWACVVFSVSVFAAPLSIVFQVVRTKSVEFMPFTLSLFLTLSAIMWFAYGLLLRDMCIALPNVLGFFLGLLQMLLYGIYRNSSKKEMIEKKLPEHIINMVALGTCEVHPVDAHTTPKDRDANSVTVDHTDNHEEITTDEEETLEDHQIQEEIIVIPDHPNPNPNPNTLNVQLNSPVLVVCTA